MVQLPGIPIGPPSQGQEGRSTGAASFATLAEAMALAAVSPDGNHVSEFPMTGGNDVIVPAPPPNVVRIVVRAHVEAPEAAGLTNEVVICIHNTDDIAPLVAVEAVETIDRDESTPAAANTNLGKNIARARMVPLRHPQALIAYDAGASGSANAYYVDVRVRD